MRSALLVAIIIVAATPQARAQQRSAAVDQRVAAAAPGATGDRRAFQPSDLYRMSVVGSPAMSPDGRLVAFTVTTMVEADNKRHTEIWVVPTAGGDAVRYTSPSTESTRPRFSRDGKLLLFTSQRPGTRGNTWALRMDRPSGEAFQPDSSEMDPEGSAPRDRRFVVTATPIPRDSVADDSTTRNDPFARMQATARPPFGAITRPLDPRRYDGRHIVDLGYKSNNAGYLPNRRTAPEPPRPGQLWIQARGEAKRQLTNTNYSHRGATVSPDGKWIAFLADARLRSDSVVQAENDSLQQLPYDKAREETPRNDVDIFILPVEGGTPRRIELAGSESSLAWSPDGKMLSFISQPSRTTNSTLYVMDPATARPRNVLGTWQYEPDGYQWMPSGEILMNATIGGRVALYRLSPAREGRREILGGRRRMSGFTYDSAVKRVAFVATSINKPTELYVADTDGRNERRLTGINDKIVAEIEFPDAERFTYTSVGNREIEGWLMKPYGYQAGRKYPVVLYIHGGPHSQYNEGWFDEFHNLAGAGMFVLFTNPRGSSGYGQDFTYSTRGQWGGDDYLDLMKAVDIVAARPDVDSTAMGVTGGSYGGFMTAWITTKTNRFKAAQTDRMIVNWMSWYGSTDVPGLTEFEFFGKPWENWAVYDTLSPIRFVDRVKTPTLIVQSEEDFRTPMADAEQWFVALRKRNVPVEFVRYPRSTHELSRSGEPWLLVDRLGRLRQWFAYWLQNVKPADRVAAPSR
jgi:dipeptidyl aminopeptidase/acylaminoacyl peptidase